MTTAAVFSKKIAHYWQILLLFFLVADAIFSYQQHYYQPLDGDLANLVIPHPDYAQVLQSPFGFQVWKTSESYPGTNRYFAHRAVKGFYDQVPLLLQKVFRPVASLYHSNALGKLCLQLLLIVLLTHYAIHNDKDRKYFLVIAALTTALFQTHGSRYVMGIIDPASSYNFFYALPSLGLLLFFLPYYRRVTATKDERPALSLSTSPLRNLLQLGGLLGLSIVLCFSGPLVPPLMLIIGGALLIKCALSSTFSNKLGKALVGILLFSCLLASYSYYLGTFNIEAGTAALPVGERYQRLLNGVLIVLTRKPGFSLLLVLVAINYYLLGTRPSKRGQQMRQFILWVCGLSLIYCLLLPWGGFREYRPNILRWDTMQPIILGCFLVYLGSTYLLLRTYQGKQQTRLGVLIAGVILFYSAQDFYLPRLNACEKAGLEKISAATEKIVPLTESCTIMSWEVFTSPDQAAGNAILLERWGITQGQKRYYLAQ